MKKDRKAQVTKKELYWYLDCSYKLVVDTDFKQNISKDDLDKFNKWLENGDTLHYLYRSSDHCIYDSEEYYGIFTVNRKKCIDPKRYFKKFNIKKDCIYKEMSNRKTHYFYPKYISNKEYFSYHLNNEVEEILKDWEYSKIFFKTYLSKIEKPDKVCPGDYNNFQCGISGVNAATIWARNLNLKNEHEYNDKMLKTRNSLYAQFWSQMSSKIEASCVKIYSEKFSNTKRWSRDMMYKSINPQNIDIEKLESYKFHDRLYRVWNFIKHSSLSTYEKLKEYYPECLIDQSYKSGDLAIYYLNITDELIVETIKGVKIFLFEWCEIVLNEKINEFKWNYEGWFLSRYREVIETLVNPLGLEWYDDLD